MDKATVQKATKSRFYPFSRRRCRQEIRELDDLSREGWHLTGRTSYRQELEQDATVQYRYAIDFRYGHDEAVYLAMFEDNGWEMVDAIGDATNVWFPLLTFFTVPDTADHAEGCWYIFRKKYDPDLPEEAYEIATDDESAHGLDLRLAQKYQWGTWLFSFLCVLELVDCLLS
ncbi:MAG: DUF2812 domain-containing protein, partial [Clostridiales bacterium]|nr:DUF2812 domain-containing protein [Clostridiales bacterium]